ncbi:MAG: hypothetical protein WAU47_08000 [Desulfobaccales bacterium]
MRKFPAKLSEGSLMASQAHPGYLNILTPGRKVLVTQAGGQGLASLAPGIKAASGTRFRHRWNSR